MKKLNLFLLALSLSGSAGGLFAQAAPVPACDTALTYNYFAESGISYNYYLKSPAVTTGFGLRIGCSNTFSVTDVDTTLGVANTTYANLRTGLEYHVSVAGNTEFIALGAVGVISNGTTTAASFAGGIALSYDIGKLLTKGKLSLPLAFQYRMTMLTATEVQPTYSIMFRKTF